MGRCCPTCQPSSRIGENPPYGMIGRVEETSASFEARSAPRLYPTRGAGPILSIWVQKDPSHSQVSPNSAPPAPTPPNKTVRPRLESKVMAWPARGLGPKSDLCVHKNLY